MLRTHVIGQFVQRVFDTLLCISENPLIEGPEASCTGHTDNLFNLCVGTDDDMCSAKMDKYCTVIFHSSVNYFYANGRNCKRTVKDLNDEKEHMLFSSNWRSFDLHAYLHNIKAVMIMQNSPKCKSSLKSILMDVITESDCHEFVGNVFHEFFVGEATASVEDVD